MKQAAFNSFHEKKKKKKFFLKVGHFFNNTI